MRKKVIFELNKEVLLILLVVVLIFSISCSANISEDKTSSKSPNEIYLEGIQDIFFELNKITDKYSDACEDYGGGKINLSEHKEEIAVIISDIDNMNENYKSLNPPKDFDNFSNLFSEGISNIIDARDYLQKYIDTDDFDKMEDHLLKATGKIVESIEYIEKAAEEL